MNEWNLVKGEVHFLFHKFENYTFYPLTLDLWNFLDLDFSFFKNQTFPVSDLFSLQARSIVHSSRSSVTSASGVSVNSASSMDSLDSVLRSSESDGQQPSVQAEVAGPGHHVTEVRGRFLWAVNDQRAEVVVKHLKPNSPTGTGRTNDVSANADLSSAVITTHINANFIYRLLAPVHWRWVSDCFQQIMRRLCASGDNNIWKSGEITSVHRFFRQEDSQGKKVKDHVQRMYWGVITTVWLTASNVQWVQVTGVGAVRLHPLLL